MPRRTVISPIFIAAALIGLALAACSTAQPPEPPEPTVPSGQFRFQFSMPSPQELYVSCSLWVRGERLARPRESGAPTNGRVSQHEPLVCASLAALYNQRGHHSPGTPVAVDRAFCFPAGTAGRDMGLAIAQAYVDYYNARSFPPGVGNGEAVLRLALRDKWPC